MFTLSVTSLILSTLKAGHDFIFKASKKYSDCSEVQQSAIFVLFPQDKNLQPNTSINVILSWQPNSWHLVTFETAAVPDLFQWL